MTRALCGLMVLIGLAACGSDPPSQAGEAPPLLLPSESFTAQPVSSAALPPVTPADTLRPSSTPEPTVTPPPTAPPAVSLMAVGDIMLARSIGDAVARQGPEAVFEGVRDTLLSADVLVGNLECALSSNGAPAPKAYTFGAPPESVYALTDAGFDVLSQANNHALDYGFAALADTRTLLEANGIAVVGAGENESVAHRPVAIERGGLRLAFLAYVEVPVEGGGFDTRQWTAAGEDPGVAWAEPDRIRSDVAAARPSADLVVVLLHSGQEGQSAPSPTQLAAAHAAIDGGAALVIGAHPHVLQTSEWYHGGLIVYSLGNFVFDGFGLPANYTAIFSAALTRDGVAGIQWIPAVVDNGLPRLAAPDEAAIILHMVNTG